MNTNKFQFFLRYKHAEYAGVRLWWKDKLFLLFHCDNLLWHFWQVWSYKFFKIVISEQETSDWKYQCSHVSDFVEHVGTCRDFFL